MQQRTCPSGTRFLNAAAKSRHVTVNDAKGLSAGSKCATEPMATAPHHRRPCGEKQTSLLAPSASAGKNVSPGDIARRILGVNSGATINKVLVVGTDGSEPVTRMEIHFADPERVPAAFTSLAATLQSSGFDLNTLGTSAYLQPRFG